MLKLLILAYLRFASDVLVLSDKKHSYLGLMWSRRNINKLIQLWCIAEKGSSLATLLYFTEHTTTNLIQVAGTCLSSLIQQHFMHDYQASAYVWKIT